MCKCKFIRRIWLSWAHSNHWVWEIKLWVRLWSLDGYGWGMSVLFYSRAEYKGVNFICVYLGAIWH